MDRSTKWFCGLLAFYCAVQALVASRTLTYFPAGFPTENFYDPLARALLEHGVYGVAEAGGVTPITDRPPLYAAALAALYALFGADEIVGVAFNNALLAGLLVLVFLIGRRIHPWAALIGPAAIMLDSIFLAQANRNQSDLLFAFLVTLFVLLSLRALQGPLRLGAVAAASVALALAVLTRAAGMYLWLALVVGLLAAFWGRERLSRIAVAAAIVVAIQGAAVLPWMARNHAISGNADYAGMKGHHLATFFAPLVVAKRDGVTPKEAKAKLLAQLEADPAYRALDEGGRQRHLAAFGARIALDHPVHAAAAVVANLPQLYLSYASEPLAVLLDPARFENWRRFDEVRHQSSFNQDSWALGPRLEMIEHYWRTGLVWILGYGFLVKAVNAAVLLLCGLALCLIWRDASPDRRRLAAYFLVFLGVMTLVSALATQGRFRLPIMPAAAALAGYGAHRLWRALRARAMPDEGARAAA